MNTPMKYSDLYIEFPSDILEITTFEMIEELNEHGIVRLHILTDDIDNYKFIYDLTTEKEIKIVFVSEDNPEIIFIGIPVKTEIKSVKHIYHMDIELKSKSFLLDCELKRRSFQNEKNPLENIFKQVVEKDNKGVYFDAVSKGALQNESIIQYDETDWAFIKRIASKLKAKLVTNVRASNTAITIGVQIGNDFEKEVYNDKLVADMKDYLKSQINFGDWMIAHKTKFCIDSVYNYFLYDNIIYKDIQFTVVKKKTLYEKGMIVYQYWIGKESGVRQDYILNEKIQGASIDGIVLDVLYDRVKLHLSIDKMQNAEEAFWYKCETPYTAEGNTGFYMMPQKGDSVKLIFPRSDIEDGGVRIINRKDGGGNTKIQNPSVKYIGNMHGKEIMLAPGALHITAGSGMLYINMDDKDGIEITSNNNLNIHTESTARTLGKEVYFRAKEEICISTKASSIIIDSEINIKGNGGVSGI